MYPLFRDVAGPYQRALWVKYVLYTHIIAFIIKSNWKLSQNLHTWTTQYVHFQCGIYWPKPVVLASSSTSISSKWNLLSEFFIFYTKSLPSSFAHTFLSIPDPSWTFGSYSMHLFRNVKTKKERVNNFQPFLKNRVESLPSVLWFEEEDCCWLPSVLPVFICTSIPENSTESITTKFVS